MKTLPEIYAENIKFNHAKDKRSTHEGYQLHDFFEIYFFISGDVDYFIEKKIYHLNHGDLLVINNHEVHKPSIRPDSTYERMYLCFDPNATMLIESSNFGLLDCFTKRENGDNNKIPLNVKQIDEISEIFARIEKTFSRPMPGSDILKISHLFELLVFINRAFLRADSMIEDPNLPEKVSLILDHIDTHLDADLSLKTLGEKFYINKIYLSSLFKKSTGTNLHEYIILKRISKAKELLRQGRNVTEACQGSGFVDYSNFIRTFTKIVGTTPGKYG